LKKMDVDRLNKMVDQLINQENLPGYLQKTLYLPPNIPCTKWSFLNQLTVLLSGTIDARGFKQWMEAGRSVKKGSKAFYILAPRQGKRTETVVNDDGKKEEKEKTWLYFVDIPVFRYEDTEGEELPYKKELETRTQKMETLPLIDVARKMGIPVVAGFSKIAYGIYSTSGKITLATDDQQTFLHELSHAIDHRLGNLPKFPTHDQRAMAEVVAELSACFLAHLVGLKADMAGTQRYIKSYAGRQHVAFMIGKAVERVMAIFDFVKGTAHGRVNAA